MGSIRKIPASLSWRKKGERISAMPNFGIHGAKNFKLKPIYEDKSGKKSAMDQVLDYCNRVYKIAYEIATYDTIKK